jgi:hypothetical protein
MSGNLGSSKKRNLTGVIWFGVTLSFGRSKISILMLPEKI